MRRIPRFAQTPLVGLGRRIGTAFRRLVSNRFVRAKRVRVVTMGGRRYKRLTLPDASVAAEIARNLETFRRAGIFPELVAAVDDELLLEYVEGRPLGGPLDADRIDALARFFAILYAVDRRHVATVDTPFCDEVRRDLSFLRDVGVVGEAAHRDLVAAVDGLAPDRVWVGWDHLDPLPRNFVATPDGRLVAVDVEDLRPDQLLGSGVAKACLRSIAFPREALLAALAGESGLDLTPLMPFVELHFLAGWTKLAYLKGRAKLVDPARFEPYRAKGAASGGEVEGRSLEAAKELEGQR